MPLPSSTGVWLEQALKQILGQVAGTRTQAVNSLATLQAGSVDTEWIFNAIDTMRDAIARFNRFKNVAGLDAYATAQFPGYSGTMTADITATVNAIQQCIDWCVANFPKDSTNIWLKSHQMAADGTRTLASFTSAQTVGLQTRLQAVIVTLSA